MIRPTPALLLALALPLSAAAQIRDLDELQQGRRRLTRAVDALDSLQVRLLSQRDSMAARTDSLWAHDPESADLVRLRLSLRLVVARLGQLDGHLDSLGAARDSLDESLRGTYDWEISRLFGLLEGGWDEGLFRQLLVFQKEREELGNRIRPSYYRLQDDQELAVGDEDGPEEIRQKIELAQDQIAGYQREQRQIEHRLRRIDREARFLRKTWVLRTQMLNLQRAESAREVGLPMRETAAAELPLRTVPGAEAASSRAMALHADSARTPEPVDAPLLLEAQRLKARQQELREVEAVLQERVGAFHQRLARILEGRE